MLTYVQGGAADVWKEIVIQDLEIRILEFETVGKFLEEIKKKFGGEVEELKKVTELKEVEQEQWTMDEYIQMLKRVARSGSYEGRLLIEKFKREINGRIRRRLMKAEYSSKSIN